MLYLCCGENFRSIGSFEVDFRLENLTILYKKRPTRTIFCTVLYVYQELNGKLWINAHSLGVLRVLIQTF